MDTQTIIFIVAVVVVAGAVWYFLRAEPTTKR